MNTTVIITKKDLETINLLAHARFYSNRKAANPSIAMHESSCPYYSDIIGLCGEWAVAIILGIDPSSVQYVYEQDEFTKVKHTINDIEHVEVRATHYRSGHLIIKDKDIKEKPNTPFILCIVTLKENSCQVEIKGWQTAINCAKPEFSKTYYTTAYHAPQHFLQSMDSLPQKEEKVKEKDTKDTKINKVI